MTNSSASRAGARAPAAACGQGTRRGAWWESGPHPADAAYVDPGGDAILIITDATATGERAVRERRDVLVRCRHGQTPAQFVADRPRPPIDAEALRRALARHDANFGCHCTAALWEEWG